ncbi:MAG TPA: hypothetical protein G4O13_00715 [Dehalococcoidia bacterium]|nr:hypothetical protein [Dehalococcoidia bacterium]
MKKFSSSVVISAPPEAVFSLINNIEEWPRWIPSIKRIEKCSNGPLGVGSQISVTAKSGITITLFMTVIEFIPCQRVLMKGRVFGTGMRRYYNLEPVEGGTKLTAGGEVSGLLSCLVCRGGKRVSDDIVQAIKRKIEVSSV